MAKLSEHGDAVVVRELIKAAVRLAFLRHLEPAEEDDELDMDYITADTANAIFGVDTCAMEPFPELTEILKRMGKVDVAGIAAKCVELAERKFNEAIEEMAENPTSPVYDIRISDFETILRSHLEGKSESK